MSTIIIGGGGKAAINKLATAYPHMTADQKAAAVALEEAFVSDVDQLCAHVTVDDQDEQ